MAKRPNPFSEEIPRQLKFHVGLKEMAKAEDKEQIYAHTKAILFQGANPKASPAMLHSVGGLNGFLGDNNSRYISHTSQKSQKEAAKSKKGCVHCGKATVVACKDCNKNVCGVCVRCCVLCSDQYCEHCSVLNYDEADVKALCLSCLPLLTPST